MNYTEHLLHYIWKYKMYPSGVLKTDSGDAIEVIDTGLPNTDAGPDFFNAKIKIGDKIWAGNIEIHYRSDEWNKHGHHRDKAYNSVILHVVEIAKGDVFNEKQQKVPQVILPVSKKMRDDVEFLLRNDQPISCAIKLYTVPSIYIKTWLNTLLIERLERKISDIERHLQRYGNSWDDVFYVLLSRNFGFGLNADEFERLALSLPFSVIQKHADNLVQLEALLFGQAGMLAESSKDNYQALLKNEYDFLRNKFSLKSLEETFFKSLRVRPNAFPQVRIAQLAALLHQSTRLLSNVLSQEDFNQLRLLFHINASEYWQTHYSFGRKSKKTSKYPGTSSLNVILINTVSPILFAYGKKNGIEKYVERAFTILEQLKPERNRIITDFQEAGIIPQNAFDTQAIIQLKKMYCDKRKCLYCSIGHRILASFR